MGSQAGRSRGRSSAARLLCLSALLAGCGGGAVGPAPAGPSDDPVPDGTVAGPAIAAEPAPDGGALTQATYTAEQAERGRRVFGRICSVCHGRNEFRGPIFALTWLEEPVGYLFQHISTTMPQDRPGSLTAEEYASVVAYFLQLNRRPAGDAELPADAQTLNRMRW